MSPKGNLGEGMTPFEKNRQWFFAALAATAVGCAIVRASGITSVDREVLFFLALAGACLLLERIRKFSLTKDGLVYEIGEIKDAVTEVQKDVTEAKKKITQVQQAAAENQLALTYGVGGKKGRPPRAERERMEAAAITVDANDPRKGQFGGKPSRDDRQLSAEVAPAQFSPGNYKVKLLVKSTNPENPLQGSVTFYLHDSFKDPIRVIPVRKGEARLDLLCYGAFTVGAIADDGRTPLELDLSEDPTFPSEFRAN